MELNDTCIQMIKIIIIIILIIIIIVQLTYILI